MMKRFAAPLIAFAGAAGCAPAVSMDVLSAEAAKTDKPIVARGTELREPDQKNEPLTTTNATGQIFTRTVRVTSWDGPLDGSNGSVEIQSEKELIATCSKGNKLLFSVAGHKFKLDAGEVWENGGSMQMFRAEPALTVDNQAPKTMPLFASCQLRVK